MFQKSQLPRLLLYYTTLALISTQIYSQYYTNISPPEKKTPFPSDYLKEYSVIYTDRSVNLMSQTFKQAMNDIIEDLTFVYQASNQALIPGSGTYGMESVARQFATNEPCIVIRNGYFSYRWTEIDLFDHITSKLSVIKANFNTKTQEVSPPKLRAVIRKIKNVRPSVVFMPHVETSTGVLLTDSYIKKIAKAVHAVGGLLVLDGIAAGALWVNMRKLGVDVYLSAPQKSWSSPAGFALVMLGDRALKKLETTTSTSFSLDLKAWVKVSDSYKNGGFSYHTTVPTDIIMTFRDSIKEYLKFNQETAKHVQIQLGKRIREILQENGFKSAAKEEWKSPSVIVSYAKENMVPRFIKEGIQVAGKVAFMIDEPVDLITFRIGVFGLDKLENPEECLDVFEKAVKRIVGKEHGADL